MNKQLDKIEKWIDKQEKNKEENRKVLTMLFAIGMFSFVSFILGYAIANAP